MRGWRSGFAKMMSPGPVVAGQWVEGETCEIWKPKDLHLKINFIFLFMC